MTGNSAYSGYFFQCFNQDYAVAANNLQWKLNTIMIRIDTNQANRNTSYHYDIWGWGTNLDIISTMNSKPL